MGLRLGLFMWLVVIGFPWILPLRFGDLGRTGAVLAALYGGPFIGWVLMVSGGSSNPAPILIGAVLGYIAAWVIAFGGKYADGRAPYSGEVVAHKPAGPSSAAQLAASEPGPGGRWTCPACGAFVDPRDEACDICQERRPAAAR